MSHCPVSKKQTDSTELHRNGNDLSEYTLDPGAVSVVVCLTAGVLTIVCIVLGTMLVA
jgi:hypothetical protein